MLNKAIEKIKTEMENDKNNDYVKVVGEFLLQYLSNNPEAAEKILAADKSIVKSLDAMRKEAEKKKKGNMAILTPNEGFSIVMKYYGIDDKAEVKVPAPTAIKHETSKLEETKIDDIDFDVKLEDLL